MDQSPFGQQLKNGGTVQIMGDGHKKALFVSLENVAKVAVQAAVSTNENKLMPLAAKALTYREVVTHLEAIRRTPIVVESQSRVSRSRTCGHRFKLLFPPAFTTVDEFLRRTLGKPKPTTA